MSSESACTVAAGVVWAVTADTDWEPVGTDWESVGTATAVVDTAVAAAVVGTVVVAVDTVVAAAVAGSGVADFAAGTGAAAAAAVDCTAEQLDGLTAVDPGGAASNEVADTAVCAHEAAVDAAAADWTSQAD